MKNWPRLILSLFLSIAVHLALFYFCNLYLIKRPEVKVGPPKKTIIKATIIRAGARVDIVAMPQHTLQELKELEIEERSNKTYDRSKERQLLLKLLRDIAKRDVRPKDKKPAKKTQEQRREPKVLLMAGNVLSEGMALTGEQRPPELDKFHKYLEELPSHIRKHWKLPSYLLEKDLRCRIRIIISKEGELINHSIIESSGDEAFDQAALRSTLKSSPYPKPDKSITTYLKQGYIILGFPD